MKEEITFYIEKSDKTSKEVIKQIKHEIACLLVKYQMEHKIKGMGI